ncbi:hypothetical protein FAM09_03620 [Niastella caeni]|uniref:Outer membrane protein beta-barrel domain-containing protein n=1 Tax=Niastella caeni TaxID=2569763 RepID=A0A4S8I313_9BACT|nr:outer membrane beta-barrel protein [Niastella caeni]THU41214.1 hypothetical protein FAM09_03620 [Niastella caeni]
MKRYCRITSLILSLLYFLPAFTQSADSTFTGYAMGFIKDSAYHYFLPSATVSIYKAKDTSLLSYQLSNSFGEFHFRKLPREQQLLISVSYTGYKHFNKLFSIPADAKKIILDTFYLIRRDNVLNEVVIVARKPPMQMNGDTLEFNADAFKLDANAVVEDLLRKLPGIIVWGDGTITVNGKPVKSVLVEGKPFFTKDARIATQNLPKNAIDKIQVYKEVNEKNRLDSTTNVNIKLKRNKKSGLFGKIGAGYGTDDRYLGEGMINVFTPRTQISAGSSINNTNKIAADVNTLMLNSAFKGVGANIEFQPDFGKQGIFSTRSGGVTFQHDFIPDAGYNKNNRLSADYFINDSKSNLIKNSQTVITLGLDSILNQKSNLAQIVDNTDQYLNLNYDLKKSRNEFYISPSVRINKSYNYTRQANASESTHLGKQSQDSTVDEINNQTHAFTFKTGFKNKADNSRASRIPGDFQIDYTFFHNEVDSRESKKSDFISILRPSQNIKFDRNYETNMRSISNLIEFKYNNLNGLLFGRMNLYKIRISFFNYLKINTEKENNAINDFDAGTGQLLVNPYLTNNSRYRTVEEIPSINFSRFFLKGLSNRYQKTLAINIEAREQFFNQRNDARKSFQNFDHSYNRFIPKASITYTNDQFGEHYTTYTIAYNTSTYYPTVNQLAPLVDSSNNFYRHLGNPDLKPSYKEEVELSIQNTSSKSKNVFNYFIEIKGGAVRNNFSDSSLFDNLGRNIHYSVNVSGNRYVNMLANLNKAFKIKGNLVQMKAFASLNINKQPSFVNGDRILSNNLNNNYNLNLTYTLKDLLALNLSQTLNFYKSNQSGVYKYQLTSTAINTAIGASLNFPKNFTVNTNITYNKNITSYSRDIKFTIWNASVAYRFLKGNTSEIKFSALDLLHQNTGIISYGNNNSLTLGNVNVLQQYFMLTFAYFPRKFGKKDSPK